MSNKKPRWQINNYVKEGKGVATRINERSETTDQLHIKYKTSRINVNSKKAKSKKIKNEI